MGLDWKFQYSDTDLFFVLPLYIQVRPEPCSFSMFTSFPHWATSSITMIVEKTKWFHCEYLKFALRLLILHWNWSQNDCPVDNTYFLMVVHCESDQGLHFQKEGVWLRMTNHSHGNIMSYPYRLNLKIQFDLRAQCSPCKWKAKVHSQCL